MPNSRCEGQGGHSTVNQENRGKVGIVGAEGRGRLAGTKSSFEGQIRVSQVADAAEANSRKHMSLLPCSVFGTTRELGCFHCRQQSSHQRDGDLLLKVLWAPSHPSWHSSWDLALVLKQNRRMGKLRGQRSPCSGGWLKPPTNRGSGTEHSLHSLTASLSPSPTVSLQFSRTLTRKQTSANPCETVILSET